MFILDWSDTGECHDHDGVHRTSGRIYKVTYGDAAAQPPAGDLAKLDENELVALHRHPNEWFVRQARRVLAERVGAGRAAGRSQESPRAPSSTRSTDPVHKLRALWSLYVIGGARRRVPPRVCSITSTSRCAPGRSAC